MQRKKTILIFGLSSFLGSNIAENLKGDYRIVGTYYNTPVDIDGVTALKCDVHNKSLVQKTILLFQPDITIYCVGLTRLTDCQDYPKLADALNTAGVFNVSAASERYHSKFIYFSTSYIFSGENVLYSEGDTPTPLSIYGNTAASAEFYIQKSCLNYLILRCPPIFGKRINPNDMTFIETLERESQLAKNLSCDDKVQTGFIDIYTLCDVLEELIVNEVTNRLLQVSSTDIMSQELRFHMDISNLQTDYKLNPGTIKSMIDRFLKKYNRDSEKQSRTTANISFI